MRKTETGSRDPLSWAGSQAVGEGAFQGLYSDVMGRDLYKLHEIKHKLDDETYVEDAVTGIANFLTETLKKKDKHGR